MSAAVVLLSGGQDSTTSLWWAKDRFQRLITVSFDYAQRHHQELQAAIDIAAQAGAVHHELLVDALAQIGDGALLATSRASPPAAQGGYIDAEAPAGLPTTFVPGRNLLFLTLAAAVAVRAGARDLVIGVSQADYSGYPDCRQPFLDAATQAINLAMPSTAGPFRIWAPLINLTKADTVRLARSLGPDCWAALAKTVTCYNNQRPGCGSCPACVLRQKGFDEAGEKDPACSP